MWPNLTLNEVADKLQINPKNIKVWEIFFDLQTDIDENGIKSYSQKIICTFEKIKGLVDQGYSLEDIYIMLNSINSTDENNANVYGTTLEPDNIEGKVEHAIMVKPLINQHENAQTSIYNLFMEKTRLIENFASEKSKLMAKIEILEFKNTEIENNNNKMISFLEHQVSEYKELLGLKDKAIRQMESHLADYVRLKQNKKWWQNII